MNISSSAFYSDLENKLNNIQKKLLCKNLKIAGNKESLKLKEQYEETLKKLGEICLK